MDATWPLDLVRFAVDKLMQTKDLGYGSNIGVRFANVFHIAVPQIFLKRLEIIGIPAGRDKEEMG